MSSSVKLLIEKNKFMFKELHATMEREKQSLGSAKEEMKISILAEVLALETSHEDYMTGSSP